MMSISRVNVVRIAKHTSQMRVSPPLAQIRHVTTTHTGSILPEPKRPRFVIPKVICAMAIGLCSGVYASKFGAHIMEEKEWFVRSDDDDDDEDDDD